MRTSQNVLSKTEHIKGAAGYRPDAERCTSSSNGARLDVGCNWSVPVRLVEGRLAILDIYKHRRGSVGYVTMNAAKIKFGRVPHGLEILQQAAGFENRTGPGGFVKALLQLSLIHINNIIVLLN